MACLRVAFMATFFVQLIVAMLAGAAMGAVIPVSDIQVAIPSRRDDALAAMAAAQKALDQAKARLAAAVPLVPPVAVVAAPDDSVIRQVRDAFVPVFMAGVLAFLGVVAANLPAAARALDTWIKLKLAAHQQDRVYAAVQTAAGRIETKIDQGALQIGDVTEDNGKVRKIVAEALAPVAESAAAQGATVDNLAAVVVGRVDTARK